MRIEEDLNFWFKLWTVAVKLKRNEGYSAVVEYQVDTKTVYLCCNASPTTAGYIVLTFNVPNLYSIQYEAPLDIFQDHSFAMDNVRRYKFEHNGLSREEFDHHMTMLKLQAFP